MTSTRHRSTWLFTILAALGVVCLLELTSWIVFLVAERQTFSFQRARHQRSSLQLENQPMPADAELELDDIGAARELVHPFLGYVNNPYAEDGPPISSLGFIEKDDARSDADFRIGVFGGSVAMLFCDQAGSTLVSRLESSSALDGTRVALENFALGGFKQPQQLLTLAYLLSLGHHFDLVINLDGFNEIALSRSENYPQQVALHYPRAWKQRVAALPDVEAERRVGMVSFLRDRRTQLATRFPETVLGWSVTANLAWRLLDRWIALDLIAAEQHAAEYDPANRRFQWQGPAEAFADPDAMVSETVRIWAESSRQMARLARANQISYLHFLQPNQYLEGSKPLSELERRTAIAAASPYKLAVEQGYPQLRLAGADLVRDGIPFFDLSAAFETVREPLYIDDCCHFSARGNELLADLIIEEILRALG